MIVLLYIGLLASFSLNVSLLLRKPSVTTSRTTSTDVTSTASAASKASVSEGNILTSSADSQPGGRKMAINTQCGNLRIFLIFTFYVKSFFGIVEVRRLPF